MIRLCCVSCSLFVCVCVCVCVCVFVATITSFDPPGIPALVSQSVAVVGASMPNVSGDASAFVVAASCSTPSTTSPTVVASTSATNAFTSSSSVSVSVSANGAAAGVYQLCVRWTATSPYFVAGSFDVVSVTSLTPNVLPVLSATGQTVALVGVGLVNVNGDGSAFVVSSTACGSPTSAVTSVASAFSSSTSIVLTVVDTGASAGVYSVCMRASSTSVYFSSGLTLTVGECVLRIFFSFSLFSLAIPSDFVLCARSHDHVVRSSCRACCSWSSCCCEWWIDAECEW